MAARKNDMGSAERSNSQAKSVIGAELRRYRVQIGKIFDIHPGLGNRNHTKFRPVDYVVSKPSAAPIWIHS